jgi:gluconolactonase
LKTLIRIFTRPLTGLVLLPALLAGCRSSAAAPAAARTVGRIERLDPRLDQLIAPGSLPEVVVDGNTWTEGPLWDPRENALLYSDVPRNAVYRWRPASGSPCTAGDPRAALPSS